mgnify:CR=1 FL=1
MSTTTVQAAEEGVTSIDYTKNTTVIEHGTISQPYNGPMIYVQSTPPVSPNVGDIWYDTTP